MPAIQVTLLLLVCCCLPWTGCRAKNRRPAAAPADPPASLTRASPQPRHAQASPRTGEHTLRSLIREASRIELWRDGLLIDLGTADQHKYTLGGWGTRWGENIPGPGPSCAVLRRGSRLTFFDWQGGIRAVALRARCEAPGKGLALSINGEVVGRCKLKPQWSTVSVPLKPQPAGRRMVLGFDLQGTPRKARCLLDWVWFRRGKENLPAPQKTAPRDFGEVRRSLVADPPRTLSYYLWVPRHTTLTFDYAASARTTRFEVQAKSDGSPSRRLFSSSAGDGAWKHARVSLDGLAGRLVRLDLITHGASGQAAWGEPLLKRRGAPSARPSIPPAKQARNLIHILVDTARTDAYRPFNPASRVKTPALDRLAAEGAVFTNAWANSDWTFPSLASLFTSRYASTFLENFCGDRDDNSVVPEEVPLLAAHLRGQGFDTAAFSANFVLSEHFGLHRGWALLRNYEKEDRPASAGDVFKDALQWLRQGRDPRKRFFLFLLTMEPHLPYRYHAGITELYFEGKPPPRIGKIFKVEHLKKSYNARESRYIKALYEGEVHQHDLHFKKLMEGLRELGLLSSTLVVYSNDHGEEFQEHGGWGHGRSLYGEVIRSPLVLRFPGLIAPGTRVTVPSELLDLLPTELEVLGLPPMPGAQGAATMVDQIHGRSSGRGPYIISESHKDMELQRAIGVGSFKLILSGDDVELYDLSQDPGEQRDLATSHPVARRACEIYLGEGIATPTKSQRLSGNNAGRHRPTQQKRIVLDQKQIKRLKALGYIR